MLASHTQLACLPFDALTGYLLANERLPPPGVCTTSLSLTGPPYLPSTLAAALPPPFPLSPVPKDHAGKWLHTLASGCTAPLQDPDSFCSSVAEEQATLRSKLVDATRRLKSVHVSREVRPPSSRQLAGRAAVQSVERFWLPAIDAEGMLIARPAGVLHIPCVCVYGPQCGHPAGWLCGEHAQALVGRCR